jgi:hypothetical protein
MIPKKQRYALAKEKFLSINPRLKQKLDNLNENTAINIGMTLEDYRNNEFSREFSKYAKLHKLDSIILVIELCTDNHEARNEMVLEYYQEHAEILGISWDDFKKINRNNKYLS